MFVELIGGADGAGLSRRSTRGAVARPAGRHRQQGDDRRPRRSNWRRSPKATARRSPSRRRSAAAFPSSRLCARASPATRCAASAAFSTAPAITSCRAWRRDGLPFDVCLAEAQKLGYAEADPTFDIGGFDTAHKLAILASLAFGTKIDADAVSVEGIESITLADLAAADELGFRIKLLGVAERTATGVEQRVHPTMVAKSEPLAQTMGVLNAVTIDGDAVGALTLVGPGAGGDATASAVAADIADIARGIVAPAFGRPVAALVEAERVPMQRHEGGYYVRLAVVDRPGAMAAIATRMGERSISLEAIMQKRSAKARRRAESCRWC